MFTGIGKNVWLGFHGTYSSIFFPWTIQKNLSWIFSTFFPLLYGVGDSQNREKILPWVWSLKRGDLRGQTLVSTDASSSRRVQGPALWMVFCPFWLGGSTAAKEENMWVTIGDLRELQFSLPPAKPGPRLVKIFRICFWEDESFQMQRSTSFSGGILRSFTKAAVRGRQWTAPLQLFYRYFSILVCDLLLKML